MQKKCNAHTGLNRLAVWACWIICIVADIFFWNMEAETGMKIFGMALLTVVMLLMSLGFVLVFKSHAVVFIRDDEIECKSFGSRTLKYKYDEVYASIVPYVSVIENKTYFLFSPKKQGKTVQSINTTKYGNLKQINRLGFIYCPVTDELLEFFKSIKTLEWVAEVEP